MSVINTNISAITAQASMNQIEGDYQQAMTRLSTGLRVNSAADDAAGLAIGEKMTAQVMGIEQAIRNATDGQSLVNTAEGAQKEITSMLQRLREVAVQSSSDTNTGLDRASLTSESKQLVSEINRIAETTTFNGMNILDGSFKGKTFQIGADQGQAMEINIDSAKATDIGSYTIKTNASNTAGNASGIAAGTDISITGYLGSATITTDANQSAAELAKAVNDNTAQTGVTATAETNVKLSGMSAATTVSFDVNGVSIGTVNIADTSDLTSLRDAINNVSNQTGVTAKMGDTNGEIILTDANGEDIKLENYDVGDDAATMSAQALETDGTDAVTGPVTLDEAADDAATITGSVTMTSAFDFSAGSVDPSGGGLATEDDGTTFFKDGRDAVSADLTSVAEIDLSSAKKASEAITVLDTAMQAIAKSRADLGAVSNRLDSTISNLSSISTSVSAAKSQIMDADYAQESTNLARSQIIAQASQAMLAQANSNQKQVLSLIKG